MADIQGLKKVSYIIYLLSFDGLLMMLQPPLVWPLIVQSLEFKPSTPTSTSAGAMSLWSDRKSIIQVLKFIYYYFLSQFALGLLLVCNIYLGILGQENYWQQLLDFWTEVIDAMDDYILPWWFFRWFLLAPGSKLSLSACCLRHSVYNMNQSKFCKIPHTVW